MQKIGKIVNKGSKLPQSFLQKKANPEKSFNLTSFNLRDSWLVLSLSSNVFLSKKLLSQTVFDLTF